MRIGVIVATKKERQAFFDVFGEPTQAHLKTSNFQVTMWKLAPDKEVYLILSGVGEISSAICTQHLIDNYKVDKIINYGVAGGLSEKHYDRKVGVVDKIVHYDFDISFGSNYKVGEYPNIGIYHIPAKQAISLPKDLDKFICASADKVVGGGEPKRELRRKFGADICEMEAAGIIITCNRNGIPCSFIKAISDGVDEDLEAFDKHVYQASLNCVNLIAELI